MSKFHMRLPVWFRRLLKSTSIWKENALILGQFRHFKGALFLTILFPILAAVFEGFGIGFLLAFLQDLINPLSKPFEVGIKWIDVWVLGINGSEQERLYRVCALILGSTWLRALFGYLGVVYAKVAQAKLIGQLYKNIFEQLQSLSLSFFSSVRTGKILSTLTSEINQLQQVIQTSSFLFSRTVNLLLYSAALVWISLPLSILAILLFCFAGVAISSMNKRVREASFTVSKARGRFLSLASELITGIRTVNAFATQDFERRRFYQMTSELIEAVETASLRRAAVRPIAEGVVSSILIGLIIVGVLFFVQTGLLEAASLLTFLFVLFRLVPVIQDISSNIALISSLQGAISNVSAFLRSDDKPYLVNGKRQFSGLKRDIRFIGVDFGYTPDAFVLKDIMFSIKMGEAVALVGGSGAGKSTLADLVLRFYDPSRGKILFDGVDLREFEINSVRRKMATVSQETFIFNATVRENITYGSEGASDSEIYEVARLANATEFIERLPEKFETILGDRGVRLSGGQRQRIAIARALLRNPEILILDEATSALDSATEKLIQESIDKLSTGRTVITIAHRLSTIENADKVVVLENGEIMEQGNYHELLKQRGKLWQYHQMQNGMKLVS